jgi:hypothetical protein
MAVPNSSRLKLLWLKKQRPECPDRVLPPLRNPTVGMAILEYEAFLAKILVLLC